MKHKKGNDEVQELQEEQPEQEPQTETQEPDYRDLFLRSRAEFENYRKRTEKERPLLIELGREKVIEKFLPLYDVMLKAEEHMEQEAESSAESLKNGLNMIFKELVKIFDSEGVKAIDCMDKPLDPENSEVLTTLPCEEGKEGRVVEEVQKGFTLNGKVIRPAKVCVGREKEEVMEE